MIHKNNKGKYTLCKAVVTENGYINYTLSKPARNYTGEKVRNADGTPKRKRNSIFAHRMVAQRESENHSLHIEWWHRCM